MRGNIVHEKALLAVPRAGDEAAFKAMVRVFGERLLAVARRREWPVRGNDASVRNVVHGVDREADAESRQFRSDPFGSIRGAAANRRCGWRSYRAYRALREWLGQMD